MKIHIRNMVCRGTHPLVVKELHKLGFKYNTFVSGMLHFEEDLSHEEIRIMRLSLSQFGLDLTVIEGRSFAEAVRMPQGHPELHLF